MEEAKNETPIPPRQLTAFQNLVKSVSAIVEKQYLSRLPNLNQAQIMALFGTEAQNIQCELVVSRVELLKQGINGKITHGHLKLTKGEEAATIPFDGSDIDFGIDFTTLDADRIAAREKARQEAITNGEIVDEGKVPTPAEVRAQAAEKQSQAKKDFDYARFVRDGDAYFRQKNFMQAEKAYRAAVAIREYEPYPKAQLEELEKLSGVKKEDKKADAPKDEAKEVIVKESAKQPVPLVQEPEKKSPGTSSGKDGKGKKKK